jgi:hypothetical protein
MPKNKPLYDVVPYSLRREDTGVLLIRGLCGNKRPRALRRRRRRTPIRLVLPNRRRRRRCLRLRRSRKNHLLSYLLRYLVRLSQRG